MRKTLLLLIVPAVFASALMQGQSPNYPSCVASPEAALALDRSQRLRDLRVDDGMEITFQQLHVLRDALSNRPEDFHLQRRYLRTAAGRFLGSLHRELISENDRRLRERPNDPVRRYLQAQSLIGTRSAEAMRLLERLAEDHPAFAWPRLAMAELHSYPAFQDQAKMQAYAIEFLRLCPDSLEPYDLLYRTSGSALAGPAAKLRSLLSGRTDSAAVRVWPRLWNLEFKVRPASEHEALRQQISKDVVALRLVGENDDSLLGTLVEGARLSANVPLAQEFEARQKARMPLGAKLRERYTAWQQNNPYPKPGGQVTELQAYRRNKVAMLDELLREDPLNFWFLQERLSLLAEDEETSIPLLITSGQRVLEAAALREEFWYTIPPALMVARSWARRGANRPQLGALVEKGLAHLARIESNDEGSDLLDAKLMADEVKAGALRNRLAAFDIAADVFIRLGEFDQARRALLAVADVVKTYRDDWAAYRDRPPDRTDRYRSSLEFLYPQSEQGFFLRQAELAKAENRKQDALAYYASALSTTHRMNNQSARNRILTDASALWKALGGTAEGWQLWLDNGAPSARAASPAAQNPPTPSWVKIDRPFPAFRVSDLNGRSRTLEDLKGAVTLVNVWATWCEPCRAELPVLQKLHERLRASGAARVITLNTDVSTGLVGPFVAERKHDFPVWLAQPLFDQLKPMGGIPLHWILDRDGIIRWESIGFSRLKEDKWIEAMLAKISEVR